MSNEKTLPLNATVLVAKIAQTGNKEMGIEGKNIYYLLIRTAKGHIRINVGEKTFNEVSNLTEGIKTQK